MKRFFRGIGALAVALVLLVALIGPANAQFTRTIGQYTINAANLVDLNYVSKVIQSQGYAAYTAASTTIGCAAKIRINVNPLLPSGDTNFLACLPGATAGAGDNQIDLFLNLGYVADLATFKGYGGAISAMTAECLFLDRTNWTSGQLAALTADASPATAADSGLGRLSYIVNGLAQYVKNCVYTGGPRLGKGTATSATNATILGRLNQLATLAGTTAFNVDNTIAGASGTGNWGWLGAGDGYLIDVTTVGYGGDTPVLPFGDIALSYDFTGPPNAVAEVTRLTALGFFLARGVAQFGNKTPGVGVIATLAASHAAFVTAANDNNGLSITAALQTVVGPAISQPNRIWDDAQNNTVDLNPFSVAYDSFWYGRGQF